ncbi:hypothetical protein FSP39_020563 [Pinctada imbricata]|uniref:N-acetyltransferase domain-containing protein n=1 Tax=Pinctada imbricata TaxID=66713 RepID=A0AA88XSH8_PINIB|nr:hypothetical protein FSP39_020563 [Pinctada imbricata]
MATVRCHAGPNALDTDSIKSSLLHLEMENERMEDAFSRPGAQLAERQTFESKSGDVVTAFPVIVDFRRLIQLSPANASVAMQGETGIITGISDRDLLHAVVGLYDVSLSEMTPDVLYSTVCEKWARTIILVRDLKECVEQAEKQRQKIKDNPDTNKEDKSEEKNVEVNEVQVEEDKYEEEEAQPSKFAPVFSDTESEEEEEDDDEEDFSKGINSFIQKASHRRKTRQSSDGAIDEKSLGVENRIIGQKDRVIHLTLLTVRKRFRKFGIGKYLLQQVIEPAVVGHYDAVVVHADNAAVDFFSKFGFSDDVVLNSKWSELAEQFTNCSLMCYLPAFSGHSLLTTLKIPGFEVFELEQEFNKWKEKTTEVYQQQVSIVMRMKHEVLQLKTMNEKQNNLIDSLIIENERLKKEKFLIEKELLDYKLNTAKAAFQFNEKLDDEEDEDLDTNELISDLQRQVNLMDLAIKRKRLQSLVDSDPINKSHLTTVEDSKYISFPTSSARKQREPYDHMKDAAFFYDAAEQFKKGMKLDPHVKMNYEVTTISKATLADSFIEQYREKVKTLNNPSMITDLYFCGGLEHPDRIPEILKNGFKPSGSKHVKI